MKVLQGKVVSNKMQRTAVVEVTRKVAHPLYKKILRKSKKYKADTGEFSVLVGDVVLIEQTRPVSKNKYFKISKVLVHSEQVSEPVDEKPVTRKARKISEETESLEKKTEDSEKVRKSNKKPATRKTKKGVEGTEK